MCIFLLQNGALWDICLTHYVICEVGPLGYSAVPLTLSQWSSSGNTVAIQCAWNLNPSLHWNATGVRASVLPVVFQWPSNGIPVVFQCAPIMQINTGSPLEHHWMLASASVVPVASQCTCGSSGLPMRSVQWYPSVLTESGLEVIKSGHFPACDP